ncbi:MAG: bifunctional aspartate kinase/homoserine dehydrogenase I [Gammaproteobacteria bacterium]|nr:bifunctional aspartate kinase/homoserine dehydrogenase I [Chromatiales bacterium]MDP6675882.1 bifunctional aspartate kinase/homoserine dehydrogenase I [Gammaproteobacteria bacterium]
MTQNAWQVHKFGGSSLADAQCFSRVADILLTESSARQAVVVSAMGGKTDALLTLVSAAEVSAAAIEPGLLTIKERYAQTVQELIGGTPAADAIMDQFQAELGDAADVLQAISLVRAAADRSRSLISGFGEIWSARLLSAFLANKVANEDRECDVKWVDARELIVVRHGEMGPAVQWDASREKMSRHFTTETNGIAVITGFIASDPEGLQTTLGRNGSDFSASIMATLLDAESIHIWTDVDGVMSADPNRVPEATVISDLSYSEAMELAYFGAKVIHPQTMSPAVEQAIPIWIKNTFNPAARGSRIGLADNVNAGIKGVTSVDDVVLVNLEGAGMIGVPGTADRLFGALRDASISVTLISQASSEHSICFAVPKSAAATVSPVVRQAFRNELEQNLIQNVEVQDQCSIIAVVGDGMAGLPGISAKFFGTLGGAGINVKAIAQGSSERNISAVISLADETRALRAVHSGFYLSTKTISIGLIGPGNVGGMLLDQMAAQAEQLRTDFSLDYRVRAIATSSRMHLAERFVDLSNWRSALESSSEPLDWDVFSAHVNAEHLPHAAIVDCSASQQVAERYLDWFTDGIHVVTPNKKAHSGALEYYHAMHQQRHQHGAHFLYETTVGAALPIIETLRDLRQTGDEITSIEGIFSGTLAYLFNVFDGDVPFSQIVREARDNGYTEPDPRDDLSGMDVARKVIILAREMGMQLELDDLVIESLVPDGLGQGNVDDFLNALPKFDAAMKQRWSDAHANGHILRYVGRLSHNDGATVRLESLPADHAFGNMNLTDNIVRYVSRRYSDNPLVVQGPGAGPAVTAAGVFADLLRLASYLGAHR